MDKRQKVMKTQLHNFFLLRRPAFSLELLESFHTLVGVDPSRYEAQLEEIFSQHRMLDHLYLASPALARSFLSREKATSPRKKEALYRSLYKYLIRMCTRCTPFGLFAGYASGQISTISECDQTAFAEKVKISLDTRVILELVCNAKNDPQIQKHLRFYPNSSIVASENSLHYLNGPQQNGHAYQLIEVANSIWLTKTLQLANSGCTPADLITQLVALGVADQDAETVINSLIQERILICEMEVGVTSGDPLKVFEDCLKSAPQAAPVLAKLKLTEQILKSSLPLRVKSEKIYTLLQPHGVTPTSKPALKADLFFQPKRLSMRKDMLELVVRDVIRLTSLSTAEPTSYLASFAAECYQRYQQQPVPLLSLFSTGPGLRYGATTLMEADDLPVGNLLHTSLKPAATSEFTQLDQLRLRIYEQAIKKSATEVELSDQDLKQRLGKESQQGEGFYILGSLLADSYQDFDSGNFKFILQASGGPSAFNLMSRFSENDHILRAQLLQCISWEELSNPQYAFAEINHLASWDSANILVRPDLRKYEIALVNHGHKRADQRIDLSDIMVSFNAENQVTLWSNRLGKQVMPALTAAHNYRSGLPIYQFLCDVSRQRAGWLFNWDWGFLSESEFLPRIAYRHVIISRATWHLKRSRHLPVPVEQGQQRDHWEKLKRALQIPRYFQLAEGDNLLLIDSDNDFAIRLVFDSLQKRGNATLIEFLQPRGGGLFNTDQTHFSNEVIIPVLLPGSAPSTASIPRIQPDRLQRTFPPGSKWIFFKIYCSSSQSDKLLSEIIKFLCDDMYKKQLIEKWFFIRYEDPQHHIRLRLLAHSACSYATIVEIFNTSTQLYLQNGIIHNISLDTYQREIERYAPVPYTFVESIFYLESCLVIDIIKNAPKSIRWQIAIRTADIMMVEFGLDLGQKKDLTESLFQHLFRKLDFSETTHADLNSQFRNARAQISQIFDVSKDHKNGMACFKKPLSEWQTALQKVNILCTSDEPRLGLVTNLMHMFFNRLFSQNQSYHEMRTYHFLKKYYDSLNARQKNNQKL